MAYYNQNFYNRNFTFQNIPPPPLPPTFFIPPTPQITDQEFVKQFERHETKIAKSTMSITQVREQMRSLVVTLNDLKDKEKMLVENKDIFDEAQWESAKSEIKANQIQVDQILSLLNDSCLESMQKALSKRASKRLRLKRQSNERKKEWEEMLKERRERSRKIDEKLQKIKEDIDKVKQEEEAKLQADSVLREVLRKKHDAKKCIVKLEALIKLRHARQNTAKGRGETVSEKNQVEFNSNVEKLISQWKQQLQNYEKEELALREQLKETQPTAVSKTEEDIIKTLQLWNEFLFGNQPQFDFKGDVNGFLANRAQWDQHLSNEGASLPTGWVVP